MRTEPVFSQSPRDDISAVSEKKGSVDHERVHTSLLLSARERDPTVRKLTAFRIGLPGEKRRLAPSNLGNRTARGPMSPVCRHVYLPRYTLIQVTLTDGQELKRSWKGTCQIFQEC